MLSHGNSSLLTDDIGEPCILSVSPVFEPAQLPGLTNGLWGGCVTLAGVVPVPAHELGLANWEWPTVLFSWSDAVCCWVSVIMLSALSAFAFVSFLGLVYGRSDVPSDGPLLRVILLLEDIVTITS